MSLFDVVREIKYVSNNAQLLKHELHLYKELFNQLDIENKNKKQVNETKHTDINCTYTALAYAKIKAKFQH